MVVPEAGRKEYLYRGLCIARNNKGIRSTFKIFNYLPESGGFVQHLPLYMPGQCSKHTAARARNGVCKPLQLYAEQLGSGFKL